MAPVRASVPAIAERGEGRGEALEILDRHVERRLAERPEAHGLEEVDPHASGVRSVERDVAMAKAAADADGGDPVPWTLDPPAAEVRDGGRHTEEPEAGVERVSQVDVGVPATDPEQGKQRS